MFFTCPACRYPVALGADGLPLPRCPHCAFRIRPDPQPRAVPAGRAQVSSPVASSEIRVDAYPEDSPAADAPIDVASTENADHVGVASRNSHVETTSPPTPRLLPAPQTRIPSVPRQARSLATPEIASLAGERVIALQAPTHVPGTSLVVVRTQTVSAAANRMSTAAVTVKMFESRPVADPPARDETHPASAMMVADVIAAIQATQSAVPAPPPSPSQPLPPMPATASQTSTPPSGDETPADVPVLQELVVIPLTALSPSANPHESVAAQEDGTHAANRRGTAGSPRTKTSPASVEATPSFVRASPPVSPSIRTRNRWQIAAIVALSLSLVLQLLLAQRASLAENAAWRPFMSGLCTMLSCTLPPWREPSAFTMLDRNVQERANRADDLRVSATFRNDARWPQPWPHLHLTLSDIDGRAIAERDFAPREYLGGAQTQPGLDSGQSTSVAFDVVAPSRPVVAFTFEFR